MMFPMDFNMAPQKNPKNSENVPLCEWVICNNVKLIAKGPFKTPLHISFHSCELLIDRYTAEFVEVELCGYF